MIESIIMDKNTTKNDTASIAKSYDEMPYESNPFADSSPVHLASIAYLFGLEAVDITQAKILELGCASGGNLIPHAYHNPNSTYIGIDLSSVQIKQGQKKIADLGLSNIKLENISISDINEQFGKFDYIIVHGVYSWVPPQIQQHILRICSENLSAKGLAFISYNTYPGWKVKEVIRDAMLLRASSHTEPHKKLAHAKGMVNFLHEMTTPNSVMRTLIDNEINLIRNSAPHYLMHEFLEEYNSPCYFKDFIAQANKFNLSYVAEAEPQTMFVSNLGNKISAPLLNECGNSQIMLEQYMDFLKNRPFRQTILTHTKRAVKIHYRIHHEELKQFEYVGRFNSNEKIELNHIPVQFTSSRNANFSVSQAIEKAALLTINEHYPASINFRQILEGAQKHLGSKLPTHADIIVSLLEQLIIQGLIKFSLFGQKPNISIEDKPMVGELNRYDACVQPLVGTSNIWHENIKLDLIQQHIIPKLDGKHSHQQLLEHLLILAQTGILNFSHAGKVLTEVKELKSSVEEHLNKALELCKQQGLFIKYKNNEEKLSKNTIEKLETDSNIIKKTNIKTTKKTREHKTKKPSK